MELDVNNELQQKYQLLASEYSKVRAQCGVLKKAIVDEQKKNEQLQRDLGQRDALIQKYLHDIDELHAQNKELRRGLEECLSKEEKLESELESLRNDWKAVTSEKESLQAKVSEAENVRRQQADLTSSQLQVIKHESEVNEQALQDSQLARDKEIERLNETVSSLSTRQLEKDHIIETLARKYNEAKQRIQLLVRKAAVSVVSGVTVYPQLVLSARPEPSKAERNKEFELKRSLSEQQFITGLSLHITGLLAALRAWLPSLAATTTSVSHDLTLASVTDTAVNFCVSQLLPALRTLRVGLQDERIAAATRSSRHAPLIAVKLDGLTRCTDAVVVLGARFTADLQESTSKQLQDVRRAALGALVQAAADAHTLMRRFGKLHGQLVALLHVARSADASSFAWQQLCSRLEAEQVAVLATETALETLFAFLRTTTALSDEVQEPDLITFDEPDPLSAAQQASQTVETPMERDLLVDTLHAHVALLQAQLRECAGRLQHVEMQKRETLLATLVVNKDTDALRNFYERTLQQLGLQTQGTHAKCVHLAAELFATRTQLRIAAQRLLTQSQELTLVRNSYEQQLAAMSDHLAELNTCIAAQYDEFDAVRRRNETLVSSRR